MTDERKTFADDWIAQAEGTIEADAAELKAVADKFFSVGPDDRVDSEPLTPPAPPKRRRRKSPRDHEIDALATFAKAVEQMPHSARHAAIGWLADKYLWIRLPRAVSLPVAVDPSAEVPGTRFDARKEDSQS